MKKSFLLGLASLLAMSQVAFADFQDVSTSHENATAINWLQANGVVQGYAGGTFKPDNYINRAEFLKMLYEVLWSYENTGLEYPDEAIIPPIPFSDVPENEWYTEYVREAYLTQVVDGYPDGTFKPSGNINFAEAVKIVMNGFFSVDTVYGDGVQYAPCHEALTDYDGIDESAWYWKYLHVADEMCMINFGHSAIGMWGFDPGIFITRADMAELLYRAKTIKDQNLEIFDANHEPDPIEVVESEENGDLGSTAVLYLDSTAFRDNEEIPIQYTCDGQDINPPLDISGVPEVAVSLVLIVDDPDAPGGEWNHWTLWNIDPETTKIAENSVPAGAVEGTTGFGIAGYGGPCPPLSDSAHHYYFELSALDIMLDLPAGASKAQLEAAMEGHIVEGVLYTGLYESVE